MSLKILHHKHSSIKQSDSIGEAVPADALHKIKIDKVNALGRLLAECDDPTTGEQIRSEALLGALRAHLEAVHGDGDPQAVADNIACAVVAMADHSEIGAAIFDAINAKIAARLRVA